MRIFILFILLIILYNSYKKKETFTNQIIEKNIFQFSYYTFNDLPQEYKDNIEKLKKENPDYTYKYYQVGSNDTEVIEFIKNNYNENILNLYNNINDCYGVIKADFFRYLLIYKKGGVYLDIKSSLNKPLSQIIKNNDEYILTSWVSDNVLKTINKTMFSRNYVFTNFAEYPQWFLISRSKHPFLKKVIESCIYNLTYPTLAYGTNAVLITSGPIMYTNTIYPIRKKYNFTFRKNCYDNTLKYTIHKKNDHYKYYKNNYRYCKSTIMKNSIFKLDGVYVKNIQTKKEWENIWENAVKARLNIEYFSRLNSQTDLTIFKQANKLIKNIILVLDKNAKIPIDFWEKVHKLVTHNNWDIISLDNKLELTSYFIKRDCYKYFNSNKLKSYKIYGVKILNQ